MISKYPKKNFLLLLSPAIDALRSPGRKRLALATPIHSINARSAPSVNFCFDPLGVNSYVFGDRKFFGAHHSPDMRIRKISPPHDFFAADENDWSCRC